MIERAPSPSQNQKLFTKGSTKAVPTTKQLTKTISNTTNATARTDLKTYNKSQTITKETISKTTINTNGKVY